MGNTRAQHGYLNGNFAPTAPPEGADDDTNSANNRKVHKCDYADKQVVDVGNKKHFGKWDTDEQEHKELINEPQRLEADQNVSEKKTNRRNCPFWPNETLGYPIGRNCHGNRQKKKG